MPPKTTKPLTYAAAAAAADITASVAAAAAAATPASVPAPALTGAPAAISAEDLRRSERLKQRIRGLRNESGVSKGGYKELDDVTGIITTTVYAKYDTDKSPPIVFIKKTNAKRHNFRPGKIIYAPQHVPHTDIGGLLKFDIVVETRRGGPVQTKKRPMVVLWAMADELLLLPFRSGVGPGKFQPDRAREYVSITNIPDDTWEGDTPWCTPALHWQLDPEANKKMEDDEGIKLAHGHVNVAGPIVYNFDAYLGFVVGEMDPKDFRRLVGYFEFRHRQSRKRAFEDLAMSLPTPIKTPRKPEENMTVWTEDGQEMPMSKEQRNQMEETYDLLIGPMPGPKSKKKKLT